MRWLSRKETAVRLRRTVCEYEDVTIRSWPCGLFKACSLRQELTVTETKYGNENQDNIKLRVSNDTNNYNLVFTNQATSSDAQTGIQMSLCVFVFSQSPEQFPSVIASHCSF